MSLLKAGHRFLAFSALAQSVAQSFFTCLGQHGLPQCLFLEKPLREGRFVLSLVLTGKLFIACRRVEGTGVEDLLTSKSNIWVRSADGRRSPCHPLLGSGVELSESSYRLFLCCVGILRLQLLSVCKMPRDAGPVSRDVLRSAYNFPIHFHMIDVDSLKEKMAFNTPS